MLEADSSAKARVNPDFSAVPFCTSADGCLCAWPGEVIGGWLRKCASSCLFCYWPLDFNLDLRILLIWVVELLALRRKSLISRISHKSYHSNFRKKTKQNMAFDLGSVSRIFNYAVHFPFGRKVTDICYFLGRRSV